MTTMANERKDTFEENAKIVKNYYELLGSTLIQHNRDIAVLKRKVHALTMLLEAERVPDSILFNRKQSREDTVSRARETWGVDYADNTEGFYPAGNQIGRRYLLPQDFGRQSWEFEKPDERSPDPSPETREAEAKKLGQQSIFDYLIVPDEAFFLIHGFRYKPLDGDPRLQSLSHKWAGVKIPSTSILFTNARMISGYYTVNLEVPPVLSPHTLIDLTAFFNDLGAHKYQLGIFGEVIAQKRYIIRDPQSLLTNTR